MTREEWIDWANKPSADNTKRKNIHPSIIGFLQREMRRNPNDYVHFDLILKYNSSYKAYESLKDGYGYCHRDIKCHIDHFDCQGYSNSLYELIEKYESVDKIPIESFNEYGLMKDSYAFAAYIRKDHKAIVKEGNKYILYAYDNTIDEILKIPTKVTVVRGEAFKYCGYLKTITLHENVKEVGRKAFYNCGEKELIEIQGENVQLGENLFEGTKIKHLRFTSGFECFDLKTLTKGEISIVDFAKECPSEIINCDDDVLKGIKILGEIKINSSLNSISFCAIESLKKLCSYDNRHKVKLLFAAPNDCTESSIVPGYIKVTKAYKDIYSDSDKVVDVNTKYIFETEPIEIERYNTVNGCRIHIATSKCEGLITIDVYESKEVVDNKIKMALEDLSKQVGGIGGLINDLENFYATKNQYPTLVYDENR